MSAAVYDLVELCEILCGPALTPDELAARLGSDASSRCEGAVEIAHGSLGRLRITSDRVEVTLPRPDFWVLGDLRTALGDYRLARPLPSGAHPARFEYQSASGGGCTVVAMARPRYQAGDETVVPEIHLLRR
jgi:hypothetical protein